MAILQNAGKNKTSYGFDVYNTNTSNQEDKVDELIKDFNNLKSKKGTLDSHCTEIAERILPDDKDLFQDFNAYLTKGDKRNQEIYDSTGILALERFAAIVDSLLTPRNSFWHNLRPSDRTLQKNKQVQDYFQEVNDILFEERYAPNANFTSQNQKQYMSLGAYGTGAMFIDDLFGLNGLRYRNVHLSELFLQENHQGIIDRICRYFALTAREAIKMFGDALPKQIIEQEKIDPDKEYYFLHWVLPREDRDPFRKDFRGMPFASYYISLEGNKLLCEGGYSTFPYAASRYRQVTGEAYGRSIAMNVLPAIKTLNEQKKTLLKQGHLATDPIVFAHDDGIVDLYDGMPGSVIPGGVSKDGRLLVQTMPVGRVDIGKDMMDEERALINDSFLVTLFQILVETPEMTATEVLERTREKGILLAPTIGRQQSEYLGPMIEREIDILARQGRLPEQPRMLREAQGEFKIIYDSPLTRTQKAEWAAGAMRTVQQLMEVSVATQDPSLLDYINWDIAAPQMADIYGTPATWLNSADTIKQKRMARAQAMQQQQQIEAAPAAAGIMKAMK
jgi:hypothetical protein